MSLQRCFLPMIEGDDIAIGKSNDGKSTATDIACRRIGDSQRKGCRNGRINRVAALLHDFNASLGGQR